MKINILTLEFALNPRNFLENWKQGHQCLCSCVCEHREWAQVRRAGSYFSKSSSSLFSNTPSSSKYHLRDKMSWCWVAWRAERVAQSWPAEALIQLACGTCSYCLQCMTFDPSCKGFLNNMPLTSLPLPKMSIQSFPRQTSTLLLNWSRKGNTWIDISHLHLIVNLFLHVLRAEFNGEIRERPLGPEWSSKEPLQRQKRKKIKAGGHNRCTV